ncbi:23394_t:CDS:2 [Dentiscutata erythropus]|uniref:23394_t:CDS:1 n=1 Tax=Dentiscutata erythropus TaxID=1348616 RepID=A0A9N9GUI5_9GLOM|nr:23394_t:CDS:2 [Dentiscutata erythropus]
MGKKPLKVMMNLPRHKIPSPKRKCEKMPEDEQIRFHINLEEIMQVPPTKEIDLQTKYTSKLLNSLITGAYTSKLKYTVSEYITKETSFNIMDGKETSFNIMDENEASFNIMDENEASFNIMDNKEASFNTMDKKETSFNHG